MTAIAAIFDHTKNKLVIAADGRCASSAGTKTDGQQKIFSVQRGALNCAYSFSGLAEIGSFNTRVELAEQVDRLSKRHFGSGCEHANKVSFNLKRVFERAMSIGRLEGIQTSEELPQEEKGRFLKLFMLGYYSCSPFLVSSALYYDDKNGQVEERRTNSDPSQSAVLCTGCQAIADMLFGNAPLDVRMARYKHEMSGADALGATTTFIRACSDGAAIAIDPYCRLIGGHIHAAELTKNEFKWLIPPIALPSSQ